MDKHQIERELGGGGFFQPTIEGKKVEGGTPQCQLDDAIKGML